jgi:AcrR family transcriptional regulator
MLKRKPTTSTKQETREALLRAGVEMFAEQGLDLPSLDALCARAGFTRGAFYVHFSGREDFTVAVMESATHLFVDALLSSRDHAVGLEEIISGFAAAVSGGAFPIFGPVPLHQFLAACARSAALRERYVEILLEVRSRLAEAARVDQRAGETRSEIEPELVGGLLLALALGVGTITELGVPFDPEAHAKATLRLLAKKAKR